MKRAFPCRHERHTIARNVTAAVWTNKRMGGQKYLVGEETAETEKVPLQRYSTLTFCSNRNCERVRHYEVAR